MVVGAIVFTGDNASHGAALTAVVAEFGIIQLLESPTEAASAVLVHGFEHEQNTSDLEHGRSNKGRNSATVQDLSRKLGLRVGEGQKGEEGIDDPDHATPCEDICHQPRSTFTEEMVSAIVSRSCILPTYTFHTG